MKQNLKNLFESANYSKILESARPSEPLYVLGALVYSDQDLEARHLFEKADWSSEDLVEACFFQFISTLRKSHYEDMKKELLRMYWVVRESQNTTSKFFLFQSLGLMHFYKGNYSRACFYAKKSYVFSLSCDRAYLSMIACDLMAHSYCMLGQIHKGLRFFEKALRLTNIINNNKNAEVITRSRLNYSITCGENLRENSKLLESWEKSIGTTDTYSLAIASLNKAKILFHQGMFGAADKQLEKSSSLVFPLGNKRLILEYNLLYSFLLYFLDSPSRALNSTHNSIQFCRAANDDYFLQKFLLLKRYLEGCGQSTAFYPTPLPAETVIKYQCREENLSTEYVKELKQKDLLGLVFITGELKLQNFIDFSFDNRSILLCLDGNIQLVEDLTSNQYELLKILCTKEKWSKQEIFTRVWGMEYDSFIHADKLYKAIQRLKLQLGIASELIQIKASQIFVRKTHRTVPKLQMKTFQLSQTVEGLNPRQIKALSSFGKQDVITSSLYQRCFQVSRNTASRDLQLLTQSAKLSKFGHGKGTYYRLI